MPGSSIVPLEYDNGSSFPKNAKFMGIALLGVGLIFLFFETWYIGVAMILIGMLICFTRYGVEFHPETREVTEFTYYLGLIPFKKSFSYEKWGFLTVIPLKLSAQLYSQSLSSTTITDYYFTICLLGKNYRGKKELIRLDEKKEAEIIAKALAKRLQLEYFEYDPKVIRSAFSN